MDTRTGEIMTMDEVKKMVSEKPKDAKFYKEIPDKFAPQMEGMNRHERRRFYKLHKKEFLSVRGK